MTSFVRGTTIEISATCTDSAGDPVTPDTATLHLSYVSVAEGRTKVDLPMDIADNVVSALWDSSVADAKPVKCSIVAESVAGNFVTDTSFDLTANEANPAA